MRTYLHFRVLGSISRCLLLRLVETSSWKYRITCVFWAVFSISLYSSQIHLKTRYCQFRVSWKIINFKNEKKEGLFWNICLILKQRSAANALSCLLWCLSPPLPPFPSSTASETARAPRVTVLWKQNWYFLSKARANLFSTTENKMPTLPLPSIPCTFLTTRKEDCSAAAVIGKVKLCISSFGEGAIEKWGGLISVGVGDANKTVALVLFSWCLPFHSYAGCDLCQCRGSEEHGGHGQLWRGLPFTSSSALTTMALLLARRVPELMRWSGPH